MSFGFIGMTPAPLQAEEDGDTSDVPVSRHIIPPPLKDLGRDYKIRLVYFVPSDSEPKPNFEDKADVLMRVVGDIYRREMKANRQKSRGLDFELDEQGRAKIHLVRGSRPGVFYRGEPLDVDRMRHTQRQEIWEKTGFTRNRAVLVFSEAGSIAEAAPIPQFYSGFAFVSGNIFKDSVTATNIEDQIERLLDRTLIKTKDGKNKELKSKEAQVSNGVLIHELGHMFGMLHDSSNSGNVMYYGYHSLAQMYDKKTAGERPVRFSLPHARMAAATRFLSENFDEEEREAPVIHKFEFAQTPKVGDKTVKFILKISDNAGLSSLVCMQRGGEWIDAMAGDIDFKRKKKFKRTVTFQCPRPLGKSQPVQYWINVMDVNGNLAQAQLAPAKPVRP